MKKFELLIEKTDSGAGYNYWFYSIGVDEIFNDGGGTSSFKHILNQLNNKIDNEAIEMPKLSKKEASEWIDNGMWNPKSAKIEYHVDD